MPESVTDRPTRSHEYIFLLTKSARYFYDADAVREEWADERGGRPGAYTWAYGEGAGTGSADRFENGWEPRTSGRNKRSVWTIATQPYAEAHFATFPPKLIEPCILAGSPPKCCGECGAPWERIIETEYVGDNLGRRDDNPRAGIRGSGLARPPKTAAGRSDLGWRPTCPHDDDSGIALVLDPFAGSGTTGLVALRHNRDFVGIELSPAYCEMARNRIYDDGPLLNVEVA